MVRGSDMDMVVIVNDLIPKRSMERLDDTIFQEKYRLLTTPHIREEIDYVVKDLNRVREQVRFDTFKHMVACKLLREGTLLYGSAHIFHAVKTMLREYGAVQKLSAMEKTAADFRRMAERHLLLKESSEIMDGSPYLFYPTEESEEFE